MLLQKRFEKMSAKNGIAVVVKVSDPEVIRVM
jgi:hypothetical protein